MEALFEGLEFQVEVGRHIRVGQLPLDSPCEGWSVRDVMNHSIGVTLKFTEFAAGRTNQPTAPKGDLIGHDHVAALRSCADRARAAWTAADMTRLCELSFGLFPADLAAGINLFDVLDHTWDIATPTGVDIECDDIIWSVALDAARAVIGTGRHRAHYANEMTVAPAAGQRERFLAFLGRIG